MSANWTNYLINTDFTEMGVLLKNIPLGVMDEPSMRLVAAVLDNYGPVADRGKWNLEASINSFSLNGVKVTYNGLNSRDFLTFSFYKYALALDFPARSTGPVGRLYMCWQDPLPPPAPWMPPEEPEVPIDPPVENPEPTEPPILPPVDWPSDPVPEEPDPEVQE